MNTFIERSPETIILPAEDICGQVTARAVAPPIDAGKFHICEMAFAAGALGCVWTSVQPWRTPLNFQARCSFGRNRRPPIDSPPRRCTLSRKKEYLSENGWGRGEGRDEFLLSPCLLFFCDPWIVDVCTAGRGGRGNHQARLQGPGLGGFCFRGR